MRNSNNQRKYTKSTTHDRHDVIDIASVILEAKTAKNTFLCQYCVEPLVFYAKAQIDNPHAGPSYICTKCGIVTDSSLEKLPKAAKKVTSSIGSPTNVTPFIETIPENAGESLLNQRRDEYAEINQRFEPNEDEQIKAMGGTIIESRIQLTDSTGQNKTYVKRSDDYDNDSTSESIIW
jgi:hypothetical protein